MTASCGCGYEWDGNLDDGEHECPADRHLQGCACADRYQVCEAASDSEEGVDDVAARAVEAVVGFKRNQKEPVR